MIRTLRKKIEHIDKCILGCLGQRLDAYKRLKIQKGTTFSAFMNQRKVDECVNASITGMQAGIPIDFVGDYFQLLHNEFQRVLDAWSTQSDPSQHSSAQNESQPDDRGDTASADPRKEIDAIDGKIFELVGKRFRYAADIAHLNSDENAGECQPKRWEDVVIHVLSHGDLYGFGSDFIKDMFRLIHLQAKAIQQDILDKN